MKIEECVLFIYPFGGTEKRLVAPIFSRVTKLNSLHGEIPHPKAS